MYVKVKTFTWCLYHDSFSKNLLRTSLWKQLFGKYTSPGLDPGSGSGGEDSGFPTLTEGKSYEREKTKRRKL
jgi:hypothetical protein